MAGDSEYESGMPSQTTSMFAERRQPEPGGLPWLLTGGALLAGILLARVIDWRAHADPRK